LKLNATQKMGEISVELPTAHRPGAGGHGWI
jgi:hypothetical protein